MKKLLFTLATVATIFATSCKKENINPATDVLDGEFIATIENNMTQDAPGVNDNMGTKTTLVNGKYITWQDGDKITINGVEYVATAQSGAQASFNISGQGSVGTGPYHAFYPATIQKQESGNYNKGTLPAEQRFNTARDANGNPIISNIPIYAYSASHSLTFHNIFAVLKIEMPYNVKSFTISSNGKVMNGDFTINGTTSTSIAVMSKTSATAAGDSTITVKPLDDNEVFGAGTIVYVAIPAQTYSTLTFKFTNTSDVEKTITKSLGDNGKTFNINKLYTIRFTSLKPCFYLEALQANSTVKMKSGVTGEYEYSTNGTSWSDLSKNDPITLSDKGDRIYIKAKTTNATCKCSPYKSVFTLTGKIKVGGDIMYLLDESPTTSITNAMAFAGLFYNEDYLFDASDLLLPATTLSDQCYQNMFNGCDSLKYAPLSLPATELKRYCYYSMFYSCDLLESIPSCLPATELKPYCYSGMFGFCYKITKAPTMTVAVLTGDEGNQCAGMFASCTNLADISGITLSADPLKPKCYFNMFNQCPITSAPELPATQLAHHCYNSMFMNCDKLTSAPKLPADELKEACYEQMFDGCKKLSSVVIKATSGFNTTNPLRYWLGYYNSDSQTHPAAGKNVSGTKTVHCMQNCTTYFNANSYTLPGGITWEVSDDAANY